MPASRISTDDLIEAARSYYVGEGWRASKRLTAVEERLAGQLSLRPVFVAKRDGMEHLVYATGKVTESTFKLFKQVLFEIKQIGEVCHVLSVCTAKVSLRHEKNIRAMGLGIIWVRQNANTIELVRPKLRCFREPADYNRVPPALRPRVGNAIRCISEGDVCVGVLDLAQALEERLARLGFTAGALGNKIRQAERAGTLSHFAAKAARRVNVPRITRAHPCGHAKRRAKIVVPVQGIVDDCLGLLFALA